MEKINRQRHTIKDYQKKLEAGHRVQPKTSTNEEMEVFQLKEELDKARQELTNGQLQWKKEKSSYHAKAFCDAKAFYEAQLDEQRAEINWVKAALEETQDLLHTERHAHTITKVQMEVFKKLRQAVSSELKEALHRAEQELKNSPLQGQEEKSSLKALKSEERFTTSLRASDQQAATQTLEEAQALHKAQLEEQRAETDRITAALRDTQDLLEAERLRLQEQSSLTAHLENTCRDHDDAQLENITALETLEEKATQMANREQASQAQLDKQRAEINGMKAALEETQDLLETERVQHKTTTEADLEIFEKLCLALAEIDTIKSAQKNTEDLLEAERRLWQQEKSSLLRAADDLQASEEYLQSLINNKQKQKKKKKWFKFF
ncbi:hypothetical protein VZT92_016025 [Zoarces viviparus]|uniref:Uncharacterized protein n=1 Tax=Zoarces viviparus TaxID=48416 RepID=A0AAW1ESS0_ZOAVI